MKLFASPQPPSLSWVVIVMLLFATGGSAWLVIAKAWPVWRAFGIVVLAMAGLVLLLLIVLLLITRAEEWGQVSATIRKTVLDDLRVLWEWMRGR